MLYISVLLWRLQKYFEQILGGSEWLWCQPAALIAIDDDVLDDFLDLEGIQHVALCEDMLNLVWGSVSCMVNEPLATAVWLHATILTVIRYLVSSDAGKTSDLSLA